MTTVDHIAGLIASPAMAGVNFAGIKSGATLSSPAHLEFKVEGLEVKPAGQCVVERLHCLPIQIPNCYQTISTTNLHPAEGFIAGTGHFHVLIDQPAPAEGEAIPFDDAHKHYGKGQTEDDVALTPVSGHLTELHLFVNSAMS